MKNCFEIALHQRPWLALLYVTVLLASLLFWLMWSVFSVSGGQWAYPLDDTYIHLAIAKNSSQSGSWSVSGEGYNHSSSAPLFTGALAVLYPMASDALLLPIWVNLPGALLVLMYIYLFARLFDLETYGTLLALLVSCLALPLAPLVVLGMEHVWHIAWSLAFYYYFSRYLLGRGSFMILMPLALVGPGIRYESLFLVASVVLMLLLKSRWRHAIPLALVAWVLPCAYGFYAIGEGWSFLPNSLWMKSAAGQLADSWHLMKSLVTVFTRLATTPELVSLIAVLLFGYVFVAARREGVHSLVAVPVVTLILHMQLASTGSFMRYEAYLVAVLICACVVVLRDWSYDRRSVSWQESVPVLLMLMLVLSPLFVRAAKSHTHTSRAAGNIFSQQVQMASFLKEFYPNSSVAVNDIGAVSFYNTLKLTDLAGLADNEVAKAYAGTSIAGSEAFSTLIIKREVTLVMLYESWYYGNIPADWYKVAELRIEGNYICGDDVVAFYAPTPQLAAVLANKLIQWQPRLKGRNTLTLLCQN